MTVTEMTISLKAELDRLKVIFEKNEPPESKKDRSFFEMVKQETAPIYTLLEEWETAALEAVKNREADVHPNQIQSTRENMELTLMHSYYVDVKRKRYMELYTSIHYVFDLFLDTYKA